VEGYRGLTEKPFCAPGWRPAINRAVWPKASARESHRQQLVCMKGKPSARSGPVSPGVIERWEGLRRLLPEPTPSPRLWQPRQSDPNETVRTYHEGFLVNPQIKNLLLGSDPTTWKVSRSSEKFLIEPSRKFQRALTLRWFPVRKTRPVFRTPDGLETR
jgi:hypothetical protein